MEAGAQTERLYTIPGFPPSLDREILGCGFAARCEHTVNLCNRCKCEEHQLSETHFVKCHNYHPDVNKKIFINKEESR